MFMLLVAPWGKQALQIQTEVEGSYRTSFCRGSRRLVKKERCYQPVCAGYVFFWGFNKLQSLFSVIEFSSVGFSGFPQGFFFSRSD